MKVRGPVLARNPLPINASANFIKVRLPPLYYNHGFGSQRGILLYCCWTLISEAILIMLNFIVATFIGAVLSEETRLPPILHSFFDDFVDIVPDVVSH